MSADEADTEESPTFLRKKWVKNNIGVNGTQAAAIHDAFVTKSQLVDALEAGEEITERDGIGLKTSSAIWDWYKNVYNGTVEPDGTLILDDDGLHLPDWTVGYVGTFTVETPNITMRPTTTDRGLGEVSSTLGSYPNADDWNDRLERGRSRCPRPLISRRSTRSMTSGLMTRLPRTR